MRVPRQFSSGLNRRIETAPWLASRGMLARFTAKLRRLPVWLFYRKGPPIASEVRRRWLLFRHPHVEIRFEGPVYIGPGFSLDAPRGGTFIVGPDVEFRRDFRAELMDAESRIEIGRGSVFTYSVLIQCGRSIEIGERVMFGQSAMVVDGNHRYRDLDTPMLDQGYDFRPIRIEDDVTTTTKCTIINSIGRRAFVGANAVVTKPIPPYSVAAGVPAKVIDYFGPSGSEPEELAETTAGAAASA